jgi:hypothetical protein
MAFLLISACRREASSDNYFSTSGVSTDQVQPYLLGDMVKFSSILRISKREGPVFISDVTALLKFEQRKLD